MKFFEILKDEGKKNLLEVSEVTIMKAFKTLQAVAPRLVMEGEGLEKTAGIVLSTALPVFESVVTKLADLNHDGKIG